MKTLAAAALSLLIASSALPSQLMAGEKKDEKSENLQYLAVSPVALPVIVKGVVVNYIFVTVRIELTNSANSAKAREKEPYFRDAMTRAGHRTPFNKPGDYTHVDEAKLIAFLYRDGQAIVGPGIIKSVTIVSQQPKSYQVSAPS
jgi:hypothetical protein